LLPWSTYSGNLDEDMVRDFLWKYFGQGVDWTRSGSRPTSSPRWELHKAARDGKEYKGGQVWAPLIGGEIPYAQGQLGCIPNTVRVAGHLQRIPGGAPVEALRRHWLAWGEISWGGIVTNVGDFFPSTGQVAGGMWKQAECPGSPDMYKVDARAIKSAWEDYFGEFFDSGFSLYKNDASIGELLAPYICVVLGNQPRLGIPNMMRPHPAPFVTPSIFKKGPGTPETWTECLFVEEDLPQKLPDWPHDRMNDKHAKPARGDARPNYAAVALHRRGRLHDRPIGGRRSSEAAARRSARGRSPRPVIAVCPGRPARSASPRTRGPRPPSSGLPAIT
jgi:hypothetical protein